ncbi:MAG: alpha/beta hydrolase [Desulfobulbaceae bacterium]|nr:alpha/beta hydrolase [Desulfobulbaceae bacterium]
MNSLFDGPEVSALLFHPSACSPSPLPEGAIDLLIPVAEDINIGCRFFSAAKDAPLIIFFHGNGEIVADYDDIGPQFTKQGVNFLVTDYRGYGWSNGTSTASTILADAHVIYRYIREWLPSNGYESNIVLMGRSLGSACAIDLAAAYNDDIKGLIIESGFAQSLPLLKTLGIDPETLQLKENDCFDNERKIAEVTKATFIFHGQFDDIIDFNQAERLQSACGARGKELQMVPGADHNSLMAVAGPMYFKVLQDFVAKITGAKDWRKVRKAYRENRRK